MSGYVAVLVKEAFKCGGADVKLEFNQWSRTLGLAKSGKGDGYFPEYSAEGVKEYAIFSDPFQGGPLGLLSEPSRYEQTVRYQQFFNMDSNQFWSFRFCKIFNHMQFSKVFGVKEGTIAK